MYLIDTNVWLERLLDQEHAAEVGALLDAVSSDQLFITDFAFHSIALILIRLDQSEGLRQFIRDLFIEGAVSLLRSNPDDIEAMLEAIKKFDLDFDDAYQYVLADRHNLTLVSFDHHFDRTNRTRKTPAQILENLVTKDTSTEISQSEESSPNAESDV